MVSNYAEWKRAVNVEYKKLQNEHASLPLSALRWIAEHETRAK